jgi:hypothetical protein
METNGRVTRIWNVRIVQSLVEKLEDKGIFIGVGMRMTMDPNGI